MTQTAAVSTQGATALPRFIALCGNPKSGKSLVQKFLTKHFGYQPIDDGAVIRRFAIDWLGLSHDDVYTQEGKARYTEILGRRWQHREILGEYGNRLEDMFGKWAMPMFGTHNLPKGGLYSFGSVRRDQGAFYKAHGGVVIEIRNPLAGPSPYEFDRYDAALADRVIENDGLTRLAPAEALADLEQKVIAVVNGLVEVAL